MQRLYCIFALTIGLAIGLSQHVMAKNVCDVTDFKDHTSFTNSYKSYVALVFTTDSSNFSQRQKELSSGASFLVEAVPVKAFADFSSFDQWRSELHQKLDYKRLVTQDTAYLTTKLTDTDAAAYRDCLAQYSPLSVTAISEQADDVTFRVSWKAPPLVQVSNLTVHRTAATNRTDPTDTGEYTFQPSGDKFLTYKLTPNEPFHMTVESTPAGYSAALDYLITRYKECRAPGNGIESVSSETVETYIGNTGKGDLARDRSWAKALQQLHAAGRHDIRLVNGRYDPSRENQHRASGSKIFPGAWLFDRYYDWDVTYDPVYRLGEHPSCGLAEP